MGLVLLVLVHEGYCSEMGTGMAMGMVMNAAIDLEGMDDMSVQTALSMDKTGYWSEGLE